MMQRRYCAYCGRVAHRCQCADECSAARQFFARGTKEYSPLWMNTPYKRGVPPQVKRRERTALRRHYAEWHAALVQTYGENCINCGATSDEARLVLDHVLPIAKGGLSVFANLQLLCAECNRIKGKLHIDCRPTHA
ncbi:MAG: HNH endonuclease signature motif containing protein [Anaerolineae bacterium]|nr:HNH endonuclease signature motif containing protein [Anaerolineae bacterium]